MCWSSWTPRWPGRTSSATVWSCTSWRWRKWRMFEPTRGTLRRPFSGWTICSRSAGIRHCAVCRAANRRWFHGIGRGNGPSWKTQLLGRSRHPPSPSSQQPATCSIRKPSCFRQLLKILFLSSILKLALHLRLGHPSCCFPSSFALQTLYVCPFSPPRPTRSTHLTFDLIAEILLAEEQNPRSSSSCSLLQSLSIPPSYDRKYFLAPHSQAQSVVFPQCKAKFTSL